jgi:hypothetical protein
VINRDIFHVVILNLCQSVILNSMFKRIIKYFEPAWCGNDGKVSKRSLLSLVFSLDFVRNLSFAVHKWEGGKSLSDLALLLSIEAGLIVAVLGLKAYQNLTFDKLMSEKNEPQEVK